MLFLSLVTQGMVAGAASIVGSKHDLSTPGGSGALDEICIFCHTPHNANADLDNDGSFDADHTTRPAAPLWNKRITDMSAFSMYKSDTLNTNCDNTPSSLSLVCLSCHDIAENISITGKTGEVGAVVDADVHFLMNEPNRGVIFKYPDSNPGDPYKCAQACHQLLFQAKLPEIWQIGPDLGNDHPISMTYPTPEQDPDFFIPPDQQKGWSDVKLYKGRVECPSCHNPHDPTNVPFLRKSMENSGLCATCHNK